MQIAHETRQISGKGFRIRVVRVFRGLQVYLSRSKCTLPIMAALAPLRHQSDNAEVFPMLFGLGKRDGGLPSDRCLLARFRKRICCHQS